MADAHFLISILGLANTIPRWERGTKEKLIKTKTVTTTTTIKSYNSLAQGDAWSLLRPPFRLPSTGHCSLHSPMYSKSYQSLLTR